MSANPWPKDDPRCGKCDEVNERIIDAASGVAWLVDNGFLALDTKRANPDMRTSALRHARDVCHLSDAIRERSALFR